MDNFVCCDQLFNSISDWKVTKLGVRSDHTAIVTKLGLISIKFNNDQQESTVVYWEKIRTYEETKYFFNDKLYELTENEKLL